MYYDFILPQILWFDFLAFLFATLMIFNKRRNIRIDSEQQVADTDLFPASF